MNPNDPERSTDQNSAPDNPVQQPVTPSSPKREKVIQPPSTSTDVEPEPKPAQSPSPVDNSRVNQESSSQPAVESTSSEDDEVRLGVVEHDIGPKNPVGGNQLPPPGISHEAETDKTPKGIYIIAGLMLVGAIVFFFSPAEKNWFILLINSGQILAAIGLLFRYEAARRVIVIFQAVIAVAMCILIIMTANLYGSLNEMKAEYEHAVEYLEQQDLTLSEQRALEEMKNELTALEPQVQTGLIGLMVYLAWQSIYPLIVIVYLTRPKVKQAFS